MRESDRGEFEEYVRARSPALMRTAYLLAGDAHLAEDLLQAALVATWRRWSRIRDRAALDAYVRRAMVTTVLSWRRRLWRGERSTAPDELPEAGRPATDGIEDRIGVLAALRRLPARQRAVVVLRYHEDLSEAEVAALLGVSVGTVKSSASRGLAALRADGALAEWAPTAKAES